MRTLGGFATVILLLCICSEAQSQTAPLPSGAPARQSAPASIRSSSPSKANGPTVGDIYGAGTSDDASHACVVHGAGGEVANPAHCIDSTAQDLNQGVDEEAAPPSPEGLGDQTLRSMLYGTMLGCL